MPPRFFHIQTKESQPLDWNGQKIHTVSQVFSLNAGPVLRFVWNQPVAVKIHKSGGTITTLPIRDVTLLAQILLILLGLIGVLLAVLFRRR